MEGLLKINYDVFEKCYSEKRFNKNAELVSKCERIVNIIKEDVYVPDKRFPKQPIKHVSAFNCKFNREDKKKKELTACLNKITEDNIDRIIEKINITEPYDILFDVVFYFITSNIKYFKLYMKVLELFPDEWIRNVINLKFNNNIDYWVIPAKFVSVNILESNDCEYDMYCEFKKWKDSVTAISSLYIHYTKDMKMIALNICKNILRYLQNNEIYMRHMLDPYLEQLLILKDFINKEMIESMLKYKIPSSSRFKIMDIVKK